LTLHSAVSIYENEEAKEAARGVFQGTHAEAPPPGHMPYGIIITVLAIALTGVYVVATEASFWSKGLVIGLLLVSLEWRYGFLIRVGLGIFLAFYFTYLKARWRDN
jgi:hypothetical protein